MTERDTRDQFRDRGDSGRDQDTDDDYYPEDTYSPWKKNRMDSMVSSVSKNSGIFFGLIGAGAFILIGLFVFMPMLKQQPVEVSMVSEMDARIKKLESRLSEFETSSSKQPYIALQEEKLNQMNERMGKLESTVTQKLDSLIREMDGLQKMSGSAKIATSEPPKTEPPAAKRTDTLDQSQKGLSAEKQSTIRYHDVQPKETLFGIGKTYGLTVDELRRLNQIPQQDLIKVGQKLRVSP